MKGDFSEWDFDSQGNEIGVLHQQGRGLLDQDWNLATAISASQRQILANDAIGASVAAVPAEKKNSFKVTQAEADANSVDITLNPGRVWVNGLVIRVPQWPSLPQPATWLEPPFHAAEIDTASIANGVRDAVILEVWPEALNSFQNPLELLEPALGGVDTTERAKLYHRLRLLRLEAGEDCGNIADKLKDDYASKGRLSVGANDIILAGDCPLETGGGYAGFEHYLMRIEIAEPDAGLARFKWSRFNGGLVGRGVKSATEDKVNISANDQMINHCGLTSFYLEALEENPDTGIWEIAFSADATLSADGELDLTNMADTWPGGDGNEAFFRLWDGIDDVQNFPVNPNPVELAFGLHCQFDAPDAGNTNYKPCDFWTFPVRAAAVVGFDANEAWPNDSRPQGIHYMRVPLAILNWDGPQPLTITVPGQIQDCRHVFQPLAQLDSCCSYTVGDGLASHGDFDSIQDAIDALPAAGGEICLLDGVFEENLVIAKGNVSIHGCGRRSHLIAVDATPAIDIQGASHIHISKLQITAHDDARGILVGSVKLISEHISLKSMLINAATRSAIQVDEARFLSICDNQIVMQDVASAFHALFVTADDVLIEHNEIQVARNIDAAANTGQVAAGRGGMQLGGTSERVQVIDNLISGGISNGITLGTLIEMNENGEVVDDSGGWIVNKDDPCDPCAPGTTYVAPDDGTGNTPTYQSAGTLYDIRIERNRILNFGLNGIGVVAFFDLDGLDEFISVSGLQILGNTITESLYRELEAIPDSMEEAMGYGGISLADVDNLVVQDNLIENNGPNHLEPICGIFVLHAEGIELSRNRILNNGAKTSESANAAKQGPRGGIHIIFTTAPKINVQVGDDIYPRQNGVPALKVHDNIVAQPLGRALSVTALGPVSVHGNQLTTQGFVFRTNAPSFLAATVYIFNMGISNEIYLQQLLFSGETIPDIPGTAPQSDDDFLVEPQAGLDNQIQFGYLGNGNVLFNDNQVMLDLTDRTGFQLGVSSIATVTLDDLAFENNQCDISYDLIFDEFFLTNVIAIGWTMRVHGNRIKEAILGSLLSALTLSLFANITSHNQGTHCIKAFNLFGVGTGTLIKGPNSILFDIFGLCGDDDVLGLNKKDSSGAAQANTKAKTILELLN
jgi:hypothetical protein